MYTVIDFVHEYGKYIWSEGTKKHWIDSVKKMQRFSEFSDFNTKPMDSYKASDIKDFFHSLRESGLSDSTINRYASAISSTFVFAVDEKVIQKYDKPSIKWKKAPPESRPHYFSFEEIALINEKLANHPKNPWMADYFEIAIATGMRRGEIMSIGRDPETIDRDTTYGVVNHKKKTVMLYRTKNGSNREVDMSACWHNIKNLKFEPGYFYTDHGFYTTWREVAKEICGEDKIKLKNFVFHVARHTAASIMINTMNLPTIKVQKKLGHTSINTTAKYVHVEGDIDVRREESKALHNLCFSSKKTTRQAEVA